MEKTIGIFYNKVFDTLMLVFSTENIVQSDKTAKIKDVILLTNNDQLVAINIINAKEKFSHLYDGINSDNKFLLADLKSFLRQNINIDEFNLIPQFVVGKIEKVEKHHDSDKLNICQVNLSNNIFQIVCGASNVEPNLKVVVAKIGTFMPNGIKIEPAKLRSVDSNGMICSAKELGIDLKNEVGIMKLKDDQYQIGTSFWSCYYNE